MSCIFILPKALSNSQLVRSVGHPLITGWYLATILFYADLSILSSSLMFKLFYWSTQLMPHPHQLLPWSHRQHRLLTLIFELSVAVKDLSDKRKYKPEDLLRQPEFLDFCPLSRYQPLKRNTTG